MVGVNDRESESEKNTKNNLYQTKRREKLCAKEYSNGEHDTWATCFTRYRVHITTNNGNYTHMVWHFEQDPAKISRVFWKLDREI